MSKTSWYLGHGAIWKQVVEGSCIYVPSSSRALPLDEVTTQLLRELAQDDRCSESLPEILVNLVSEGVLTQRADKGHPLVMNRVEPRLDYIVLRLTNACNLRCRHCFVASGKPEPGELSLAEIERLFKSLDIFDPLIVVLTGGEPLLRRDIFDVIMLAAEHKVAVDISTNGTLLDEPCLERFARLSNLRYVIISLEGPSAQVHDYIRGSGNFDMTVALVRKLVERGIAVSVNHCVTGFNIAHLSRSIDLALSLGAWSVHLATVSESGRARDHWSDLSLTEEQRRRASLIGLRKYLETGRVFAGEAEREVMGIVTEPSNLQNCGVGYKWCMIYANGDIAPCRPLYAAVGAVGNIHDQSFESIWRDSPLMNELRAVRADEIPRCKTCRWLSRCRAGCRVRAYTTAGSWVAPESESFCQHYHFLNVEINRACWLWQIGSAHIQQKQLPIVGAD
jgi:radical SAM protein with 4Fe4S-binding SPASM domain